ncbi:MAG TPA: DUF1294 domain-containing protein [Symbiobacteriaceae bacterium]|nr:DUF1294 domain-containing protein [Symbiobacteriaceae bacterium]
MSVWIGLGLWNGIVFFVYALDKLRARRGWRRTPEATLLWLGALGGGPGACLGVFLVRHKTRKPRFAWGVPAITVAQVALALWGRSRGWW